MSCIVRIYTNIPKSGLPRDFVSCVPPILKKVISEPSQNFVCVLITGCLLNFGGSAFDPSVFVTIESRGKLGPIENKIITDQFTAFLNRNLGVNKKRVCITFHDVQDYNIGINGDTLAMNTK